MSEANTHAFFAPETQGIIRCAASTPRVRTADIAFNTGAVIAEAQRAEAAGVDLVVFPELCVTGYAIEDLHMQAAILDAAEAGVAQIVAASKGLRPLLLIGAPLRRNGRIYNCACAIADGRLLGVVPKSFLPNYREFYEKRWFADGRECQGIEI